MPTWVLWLLAAIPSIILHEIAHGAVANHYGDPTAKNAGRLTLNPISHIDPVGTVLLPLIMAAAHLPTIGYAKPVPVNVNRLRSPRNQSVYVSLAGPATNVILSALAWAGCRIWIAVAPNVLSASGGNIYYSSEWALFLVNLGIVNLLLAFINMIPIPPLDGSAVIERMVPRHRLPQYFQLRNRMLPLALFGMLLLYYTHAGTAIIGHLENVWLNLL